MTIRLCAVITGCTLLLTQTSNAQGLDDFLSDTKARASALVESALTESSDADAAAWIGNAGARERFWRMVFDTNLDPSGTPAWSRLLAWEGGAEAAIESMIKMWHGSRQRIIEVVLKLPAEERSDFRHKVDLARAALSDYRLNRLGVRAVFREQRDSYALCQGRHSVSTHALSDGYYRIGVVARDLKDDIGALSFADRLWSAGGYALTSAALDVSNDISDALEGQVMTLQSSLPQPLAAEPGGVAVSTLQ